MLEAFIRRFGTTVYGEMARARLGELRATAKQVEATKQADKLAAANTRITPPAPPEKTATQAPVSPCRKVAGVWSWFVGGDAIFKEGGTVSNSFVTGTWTCRDQNIVIEWSHGFTDRLIISADGTRMNGRNQIGSAVSGSRKF